MIADVSLEIKTGEVDSDTVVLTTSASGSVTELAATDGDD